MPIATLGPWEGLTIAKGRYQDLRTLGEGGMGYVYRAVDRNLQTHVVIKSPRRTMIDDPEQISRFEREISAMVRLSHPHIVPVIDLGHHEEIPFAVMQFMAGGNLDDRIPRDSTGQAQPMAVSTLELWLPSVAKALDFVHGQQCLHRDVKPANILFDRHEQAYLSDFGVIKVFGDAADASSTKLTGTGFIVGTVDYMAPELLSGAAFDGRADQYALAVTVYQTLAGRVPFVGNTIAAVMVQHLQQAPPPLPSLVRHVSPALSDVITRGLAKDANHRFATCRAFADAVLQAAASTSAAAMASPTRATERIPTSTANTATNHLAAPVAVAVAQPVSTIPPLATRRSQRPMLVGVAVSLVAVAVGLATWAAMRTSHSDTSEESPLSGAAQDTTATNELTAALAQFDAKLKQVETSLRADYHPLMIEPAYNSSSEFSSLVSDQWRRARNSAVEDLDQLDPAMEKIVKDHADRVEAVEAALTLRLFPANDKQRAERDRLRRENELLDDQAKQIAEYRGKLAVNHAHAASVTPTYTTAMTSELRSLEEIQKVAISRERLPLSSNTQRRAAELLKVKNVTLADKAAHALARGQDSSGAQWAIGKLASTTGVTRADWCWSLLVNGDAPAIAAVAETLKADPQLLESLDRTQLLTLARGRPEAYQSLYANWAPRCKTPAERVALFDLQSTLKNPEWIAEIEQSSQTGMLNDEPESVIVGTIQTQWKDAYPLVSRLLVKHPQLTLRALPASAVNTVASDDRQLAGHLTEQFLVRGTREQRAVAAQSYREPTAMVDQVRLESRLTSEGPFEPVELLNVLLPSQEPKLVSLAAFIVTRVANLPADKIEYDKTSPGLLTQEPARRALMTQGWKGSESNRSWVMQQVLGNDFTVRFESVCRARSEQPSTYGKAIGVLNGKLEEHRYADGTLSSDKARRFSAGELRQLPKLDKDAWAPTAPGPAALGQLIEELKTIRSKADASFASSLTNVDEYLRHLKERDDSLNSLMRIYYETIDKQLSVALKGTVPEGKNTSFGMRFVKGNIDRFVKDKIDFETASQATERCEQLLPLFLRGKVDASIGPPPKKGTNRANPFGGLFK